MPRLHHYNYMWVINAKLFVIVVVLLLQVLTYFMFKNRKNTPRNIIILHCTASYTSNRSMLYYLVLIFSRTKSLHETVICLSTKGAFGSPRWWRSRSNWMCGWKMEGWHEAYGTCHDLSVTTWWKCGFCNGMLCKTNCDWCNIFNDMIPNYKDTCL